MADTPKDVNVQLNDRIEDIARLIFEVASGNFDFSVAMSGNDDELDAIISGINMLGEELKNSTVSRDYMRSIYDGVVDMLIVMDQNLNIREVNDAVIKSLGIADFEFRGMPLSELIEYDGDREAFLWEIQKKLDIEGQYRDEIMLKTRQGSPIPTSSSFSYLKTRDNQVDGIMIIARDITRIKETERELTRAKERAEEANLAKGRFLSNMSHEIRTPLNGIIGFTDLLVSTKTDDTQKEYLRMIKTSGDNLAKLLNDVLDLNKIDLDKLNLEKTPFDFRGAISSNLNPYKFLAREKGITLTYHFDEKIPTILQGDPTRINQILINLVGNALKFTEEGTIDVHFSAKRTERNRTFVHVEVSDTGIGVPEDRQEQIFDTFTQSDSSMTRKYGGSGLGLAICRQLTLLMNGEIGVRSPVSDQQSGSVFWFTIPLETVREAAPEGHSTITTDEYTLPPNIKILAVDDNRINLILLQKILSNAGAIVVTAENGREAVSRVEREEFDVILMDIQMPVMDGFTATTILREQKFDKPILALSANVDKENIVKCKVVGMDDYLQKPFQRIQLFDIIKKWVNV